MPNFVRNVNFVYHFTDASNLDSIRRLGGLYSWAQIKRRGIEVLRPGGNELSHSEDERSGVDDYVHLCFKNTDPYFKNDHPMAFKAKEDGRISTVFYVKISPQVLALEGVLFTADVSNKVGVQALTRIEANEAFDFPMLNGRVDLRDPEIRARFNQAKKYEALIPGCIPAKYLLNI